MRDACRHGDVRNGNMWYMLSAHGVTAAVVFDAKRWEGAGRGAETPANIRT